MQLWLPSALSRAGSNPIHAAAASAAARWIASPRRKVHATGRIKLGPRYRGKVVTVVIEDTHLRVLHGDEEIAVRPRRDLTPITRLHVTGVGVNPRSRQASPDDKTPSES